MARVKQLLDAKGAIYEEARAAEFAAVRGGDYNFPGIGLSAADHVFLAERRAKRAGDDHV